MVKTALNNHSAKELQKSYEGHPGKSLILNDLLTLRRIFGFFPRSFEIAINDSFNHHDIVEVLDDIGIPRGQIRMITKGSEEYSISLRKHEVFLPW